MPLAAHYVGSYIHGLTPTGFIQYDMPYYWANARELSDAGGFSFFYGNPFSYDYGTPAIYFQPLTLLMGFLATTGIDPGVGFALTGLVTAVVCARIAIALYDRFSRPDLSHRTPGLIAFFWGGGVLMVAGLLYGAATEWGSLALFTFDPAKGWWFLNFGRNLVFPTEALYHAIFFAAVLLMVAHRYGLALCIIALMSVSHPFTGIQLILIVFTWSAVEVAFIKESPVPYWFLVGVTILGLGHAGYYLWFLNRFPEHRALQEQWTIPLLLGVKALFLSTILVAIPALWRMRTVDRARAVLADSSNRLLVAWLIVSVLLAEHDRFLTRAIQPVHFSRGHQWIPLFLLGLPAIIALWGHVRAMRPRLRSTAVAATLIVVMLADNATWLTIRAAQALGISTADMSLPVPYLGMKLSDDQFDLMRWMRSPSNRGSVVASEDDTVGYLLTTYTPLRSWRSHTFNTPFTEQRRLELRAFFDSASPPATWQRLPMLLVFRSSGDWRARLAAFEPGRAAVAYSNRSFVVGRVSPRPPESPAAAPP